MKNKLTKLTLMAVLLGSALSFASGRTRISAERAKQIALARVPGATKQNITKFETDSDSYEGEIRFKGVEYDFEIDAFTGRIKEWEVDRK